MVGAFVALISFILFALTGISLPIVLILVLLIAMVFTACYGWTVEKLAYKPLRKSFKSYQKAPKIYVNPALFCPEHTVLPMLFKGFSGIRCLQNAPFVYFPITYL